MEKLNDGNFKVNTITDPCDEIVIFDLENPVDRLNCGQLFVVGPKATVSPGGNFACINIGPSINQVIDVNTIVNKVAIFSFFYNGVERVNTGFIGDLSYNYGGANRFAFVKAIDVLLVDPFSTSTIFGYRYPNYDLPNIAPDGYPYVTTNRLKYSFLKNAARDVMTVTVINLLGGEVAALVNCPAGFTPQPSRTPSVSITPTITISKSPSNNADRPIQCGVVYVAGTSSTFTYDVTAPTTDNYDPNAVEFRLEFEPYISPDRIVIFGTSTKFGNVNEFVILDTGFVGDSDLYGFGKPRRNQFNNSLVGQLDPITLNSYPNTQIKDTEPDGFPVVHGSSYDSNIGPKNDIYIDISTGNTKFGYGNPFPFSLTEKSGFFEFFLSDQNLSKTIKIVTVVPLASRLAFKFDCLSDPFLPSVTPTQTKTATPTPTRTSNLQPPTITPTRTISVTPTINVSVTPTPSKDWFGPNPNTNCNNCSETIQITNIDTLILTTFS
jgi:hypothetical protein